MASLALLVTLMLLFVVLLGPATYLLSKSEYIPKEIIWIMGLLSLGIGMLVTKISDLSAALEGKQVGTYFSPNS